MRALARCSRRSTAAAVILLVLVLAGFAAVVLRGQQQSQAALEERFELRSALAARAVETFVDDVVRQEKLIAKEWLSGPRVAPRELARVAERFDFSSAVILDRRGRVLAVYPHDARLVGTAIGPRYPHFRAALRGRSRISDVVSSSTAREAEVSLAVPYNSREGRRVFSGAFQVGGTALSTYLRTSVPLAVGSARLLDSRGRVIVTKGEQLEYDDSVFVAPSQVEGTGWRVELAAPRKQLFAPISGLAKWAPWLLFGGFALTGAGILVLFLRLLESRTALAERNVEVTRLMRAQQRFVASTSHELRTPLTSVLGYLDLLRQGMAGELSGRQQELLDVARRNAKRLLDLVADLMLAAQLDAGRLELDREPVALEEIARQSVENALPAAGEKRIELVLDPVPVPSVLADPRRVAQVVDNLVSNALKFTPEEGRVEVRSYRQNGTGVIEVADSGIGIPEAEQARVFQRFFRASSALEEEIPGTGLGLSIARTLAELQGGRLEFASEAGSGSTFRLELPLTK